MEEPSTPGGRGRTGSMEESVRFSELKLVLVGKTGVGKSSCGNTILGGERFKAAVGHSSETSECTKQSGKMGGKEVTIVDTPGLFDTLMTEDQVKREISKCINMSAPGPHAILLVIKAGRFTKEDRVAVQKVEEVFGEKAWKHTIILFTHGDKVEVNFDEMLKVPGPELQEILEKVDKRYHLFNNYKANERGQVLDLLKKVEEMVAANGGECYSNPTYVEVMDLLNKREKELNELYKTKLEEGMKAVELKYQKKLEEAQEERQQVEKEQQCELDELKRYYQVLESGVRHVVEQIAENDPADKMLKEFHEKLCLN